MDISETTAPRSDQLNFDDVSASTVTVTISEVRAGSAEQPVEIHLAEFPGRPFKPSKSMRRVFVNAWGPDSKAYVGRRMTLYGDPSVKFGGQTVGGIRISHMSHISKKLTLALTVTRGKRAPYSVDPLPDGPPVIKSEQADDIAALIATAANRAELDAISAQLKTFDLADQRARLLELWTSRLAELTPTETFNEKEEGNHV